MRWLLCLVALFSLSAALLVTTPGPIPVTCPAWAVDYVRWHQANRGASNSRHLTAECPDGYKQGGLGDHLRGIMYAMRVASKHNLVLFIQLPGVLDFIGKLDPAHIDWRKIPLNGTAFDTETFIGYKRMFNDKERWFGKPDEFEPLPADNLELVADLDKALADYKSHITICSTLWHNFWHPTVMQGLAGAALSDAESMVELHCLWSLLYTPSPMLRVKVAAQLMRMYGTPSPKYVAAHLRLGGMQGELSKHVDEANDQLLLSKANDFVSQHAVHLCALDLKNNVTMNGRGHVGEGMPPALLVTDNAVLRHAAHSRLLSGMVGPGHYAVHLSRGVPSEADQWNTYIELGLLARATCLIRSDSGFSNIAMWWGGATCVKHVNDCIGEFVQLPAIAETFGTSKT